MATLKESTRGFVQFASEDPQKEIRTIRYGKREENPENLGVPHLDRLLLGRPAAGWFGFWLVGQRQQTPPIR